MKNLITNFLAARHAAGLREEFLRQFRAAVADGQLTDEELAWLAQHQDEMDPDATWHQSAPDLFTTAVDALLERGEGALSPEADAQLDTIRKAMQVHSALIQGPLARIEAGRETYHKRLSASLRVAEAARQRQELLAQLASGTSDPIPVSNVVLGEGEGIIWRVPGTLMEYRVIGRRGGSRMAGVSVRVARGVSVHTGGSSGASQAVRDWDPVSVGTLLISNQRILFIGSPKSIDARWEKLLDIRPESEGLTFTLASRHKQWHIELSASDAEEITAALKGATQAMRY